eukprot:2927923-Rhodomonas_salina.1
MARGAQLGRTQRGFNVRLRLGPDTCRHKRKHASGNGSIASENGVTGRSFAGYAPSLEANSARGIPWGRMRGALAGAAAGRSPRPIREVSTGQRIASV